MEVKLVITAWQLITAIVTISGLFAVNTYMTRKNSKEVGELKDKDLVTWGDARNTFVSKELYNNQMEHIDTTLGELKEQNKEILSYVRK